MTNTKPNPSSKPSLRRRVFAGGIVILAIFMVITGLALERAFQTTVEQARQKRLEAQVFMLMGTSNISVDGQVEVPATLAAPELSVTDSGQFAAITDTRGTTLWTSDSSIAAQPRFPILNAASEPLNGRTRLESGLQLASYSFPVIWEVAGGEELALVFHAAEDQQLLRNELARFRETLLMWLGGAATCLLLLQALLLNWLLRPLQQVGKELADIESGDREFLSNDYPRELSALTDNLNALIKNSQRRMQRYRNGLADLAHSLKTPLAVARNIASEEDTPKSAELQEQIERMEETIGYQLQRASTSGRSPLANPVPLLECAQRIADSLAKVYQGKGLQIDVRVPAELMFRGDKGDLLEMLGNLGDNACKWAEEQIVISARETTNEGLEITVADDGPGIADDQRDYVMQRGARADTRKPGQGIGLAVVREMVEDSYAGELEIGVSSLGGATVTIRLS